MAALDELPFDIFVYLCRFFAPFDMLSAMQTCQRLYNYHKSGERLIWIDQLRTTAALNQSFLTTSSLESMQTPELRHAATAPSRMLRRLEDFAGRKMSLEYFSRKTILADSPVSDLFLVPGGRYLVLFNDRGLEIWDLETNYHLANPIKNQAFVPDDFALLCAVAQHSSPGKGAFRIATKRLENDEDAYYTAITVYEFLPQSATPRVLGKTRTAHHSQGNSFILRGDLLVFYTVEGIEFWNFTTGRRLTWTMPYTGLSWIMTDSSTVALIGTDVMQAWKIPEDLNQPLSSDEAISLVVPVPPPDIIDFEVPQEGSRGLSLCGWYSFEGLFFDHFAGDDVRRTVFAMQPPIPAKTKGTSRTGVPWNLEQRLEFNAIEDYRLCEDRNISVYVGHMDIRAFVMQPTPAVIHSPPHSPLNSHTAPLNVAIAKHAPLFSLDPTSGRMCCFTYDDEILIYDFLKQPLPSM